MGADRVVDRANCITVVDGEPTWDDTRIFPDPEALASFRADVASGLPLDALAREYPRWAEIADRPAAVVFNKEEGHPACV